MPLVDSKHEEADRQKSPQDTRPEEAPKRLPCRQTVRPPRTMFDASQHNGRNDSREEIADLLQHPRPEAAVAQIANPRQLHRKLLKKQKGEDVKTEAPSRTKPIRAVE